MALALVAALSFAAPAHGAKAKKKWVMPPSPPVLVQQLKVPLAGASSVQSVLDGGGSLPLLPARIATRYNTLRIPPAARGVVLILHGGGWWWRGRGVTIGEDSEALDYAQRGFVALNVDFGYGSSIRGDVQAWYDWAAKAFPGLPICASGGSSGGSIALTLAAWRPRLSCVVTRGPITNLFVKKPTAAQKYMVDRYARPVFRTKKRLTEYSPLVSAPKIRAQVLAASADRDPAAPCTELRRYRNAARKGLVKVLCLEHGDQIFMHETVSKRGLGGYKFAKDALLNRVAPIR